MAERIERQLRDTRQLLAHELRTPLARTACSSSGRSGHRVPDQMHQVLEMDALVGQLLASARLDFSAMALRLPLDAGDLGARALERAAPPPGRGGVRTALGRGGDPTLLQRALSNLLENARVHGGGVTRLRVDAPDGVVRFAVEDSGPGLTGSGERTFQPFFQRGETSDGLGLGLALVRRIAEAHGDGAFAETPEGGARVRGAGSRSVRMTRPVRGRAGPASGTRFSPEDCRGRRRLPRRRPVQPDRRPGGAGRLWLREPEERGLLVPGLRRTVVVPRASPRTGLRRPEGGGSREPPARRGGPGARAHGAPRGACTRAARDTASVATVPSTAYSTSHPGKPSAIRKDRHATRRVERIVLTRPTSSDNRQAGKAEPSPRWRRLQAPNGRPKRSASS